VSLSGFKVKLKADSSVDGIEILPAEGTEPSEQATLAGCGDLVSMAFRRLPSSWT
jgi:hypothetical protein